MLPRDDCGTDQWVADRGVQSKGEIMSNRMKPKKVGKEVSPITFVEHESHTNCPGTEFEAQS
jgi:hypothetical protein